MGGVRTFPPPIRTRLPRQVRELLGELEVESVTVQRPTLEDAFVWHIGQAEALARAPARQSSTSGSTDSTPAISSSRWTCGGIDGADRERARKRGGFLQRDEDCLQPARVHELQRAQIEHHVVAARELLLQDILELGHGCQVKLALEPSAHLTVAGGVEFDGERGRLQR